MPARFPRRPGLTLVGAVGLVIALANPAAAPPGDLDPTFDDDGRVTAEFNFGEDVAFAVAVQEDGKIVAAGGAVVSVGDFALARFNLNGSLDTTFDGNGRVTTDFAGDVDQARGVAIQGDGKIVAAGSAGLSGSPDIALARYNTDGSLDATFGGDGRVTTDFAGSSDEAFAVAIQGDGKIVAAGRAVVSGNFDFALARYNTDGSLDATFDGDGRVNTDFGVGGGANADEAFGVAIQADDRIVAAGCTPCDSSSSNFALARYNTDGSLDATFDGDGRVNTNFADTDEAFAVAIQGDGKIVAAGRAVGIFSGIFAFALARYNNDGSLDTTFDGDGRVITDFGTGGGNADQANAVAIQGDGKIVAAGYARVFDLDFALARYNTDGSPDTTFSGDGRVTTDFAAGSSDQANAVAIQGDGKIVAAGCFRCGIGEERSDSDFALARYTCLRRSSRPMSIPICP